MRSWLVVVALAAGCWTERAPAQTPAISIAQLERRPEPWPARAGARFVARTPDRCATVIAHVFELTMEDATGGGLPPAMLDELLKSTVESCHETQWSDESLDCYQDTRTATDTNRCYRSMTEEQREDFEQRFTGIMHRHQGGSMATSPPPP